MIKKDKSQKYLFYGSLLIYVFLVFKIIYGIYTITIYEDLFIALFVLTSVTFIPLLLLIARRNFNLFEPIYIYIHFFAIFYIYSTYYILNNDDVAVKLFQSVKFEVSDPSTVTVIYLLAISIIFLYIGYILSNFLHRSKIFSFLDKNKMYLYEKYFNISIILYIVIVLFRFYGYGAGFLGSTANESGIDVSNIPMISLFYFLSNNWYIFFTYFCILSFSSSKYYKIFITVFLLEFLFSMMSGNRRYIIVMAFSYLAVYWYVNHMFPWKKIIIPSVFILFVFLPISTIYGYYLANNIGTSLTMIDSLGYLLDAGSYFFNTDDKSLMFNYIFFPIVQSFNLLSNVTIAYTEFYLNDLALGPIGIKSFLGQLVPTFLNPDKHDYSRQFLQLYGDNAYIKSREHSTLSISFATEMIISYGIIGIFIGHFIIGFLMNLFYKYLNNIHTPIFFQIFYISNLFFFSYGLNGNWLGGDMVLTYRLLVYFVVVYIFYKFLLLQFKKKE
jgi:hypothetical protein